MDWGYLVMGEVADDMIEGNSCSHCGTYFEDSHGFPVLCRNCFDTETPEERADIPRATEKEI